VWKDNQSVSVGKILANYALGPVSEITSPPMLSSPTLIGNFANGQATHGIGSCIKKGKVTGCIFRGNYTSESVTGLFIGEGTDFAQSYEEHFGSHGTAISTNLTSGLMNVIVSQDDNITGCEVGVNLGDNVGTLKGTVMTSGGAVQIISSSGRSYVNPRLSLHNGQNLK
jgi:hypothetical protein